MLAFLAVKTWRNLLKKLPEFDSPPVIEVVAGLTFSRIDSMQAPHMGAYWTEFLTEESFPYLQSNAPRLTTDLSSIAGASQIPLPRIWFLDDAGNKLIQLQQECFYFNWKKSENEQSYPRYKSVIADFFKYFGYFCDMLEKHELGNIEPKSLELTYVNRIPIRDDVQEFKSINNVINFAKWNEKDFRFLNTPLGMTCELVFKIPELDTNLSIVTSSATTKDTGERIIQLTLSVRGEWRPSETIRDLEDWFGVAHEWIVRGFDDFTTNSMHKIWGKFED